MNSFLCNFFQSIQSLCSLLPTNHLHRNSNIPPMLKSSAEPKRFGAALDALSRRDSSSENGLRQYGVHFALALFWLPVPLTLHCSDASSFLCYCCCVDSLLWTAAQCFVASLAEKVFVDLAHKTHYNSATPPYNHTHTTTTLSSIHIYFLAQRSTRIPV
jgi:hypothetical protein